MCTQSKDLDSLVIGNTTYRVPNTIRGVTTPNSMSRWHVDDDIDDDADDNADGVRVEGARLQKNQAPFLPRLVAATGVGVGGSPFMLTLLYRSDVPRIKVWGQHGDF